MHVLIVGGTRFIGPAVVRRLQTRNVKLTFFHRGQTNSGRFPEYEHITGDRRQLPEFRAEFERVSPDVVLDMAPLSEAHARTVLDTFRGVAKRVVTISSCDVYRAYGRMIGTEPGPPDPMPLSEDSPVREKHFPYRGKAERFHDYEKILVERTTLASPDPSGTALRLPMVYGPEDYQHRLWPYLKRMRDGRPTILLDQTLADWRVGRAFVEDVGEAIALAITDDRAAGRLYNVAEQTAYSEEEWVKRIGEAMGWAGRIVTYDRTRFPELDPDPFNAEQELVIDTQRIRAELSFREIVSDNEALHRTIEWELQNPPDPDPVTDAEYAAEDEALAQMKTGGPVSGTA